MHAGKWRHITERMDVENVWNNDRRFTSRRVSTHTACYLAWSGSAHMLPRHVRCCVCDATDRSKFMLNAVFCFVFLMRRIRWRSFGDQGVPCVQASEGTWTQMLQTSACKVRLAVVLWMQEFCYWGQRSGSSAGWHKALITGESCRDVTVLSIFAVSRRQKHLSVAVDIFSNSRSPGKKVLFPATAKHSSYHRTVHAHHPLHSARSYRAGSKAKVADGASGEKEQ